jgi:hypothetical protein
MNDLTEITGLRRYPLARRGFVMTKACPQLAGLGRCAPPGHRIGQPVSPDCHTQPSIGAE